MKFLCLECNQPMKLYETGSPDRGSMAIKFECPTCLHQIQMLTNAGETRLVSSLGLKIGGKSIEAGAVATEPDMSKCPFAAQVAGEPAEAREEAAASSHAADGEVSWTDAARARLDRIPAFVRPMAITGIERFAREHGYSQIDEAVLDQVKNEFGM